jgi:hypothetical protein
MSLSQARRRPLETQTSSSPPCVYRPPYGVALDGWHVLRHSRAMDSDTDYESLPEVARRMNLTVEQVMKLVSQHVLGARRWGDTKPDAAQPHPLSIQFTAKMLSSAVEHASMKPAGLSCSWSVGTQSKSRDNRCDRQASCCQSSLCTRWPRLRSRYCLVDGHQWLSRLKIGQ